MSASASLVTTPSRSARCLDENAALDLIEGQLASTERAGVERHLEECDACRELVAELAKVDEDEGERERIGRLDTHLAAPLARAPQSPPPGAPVVPVRLGPYRIERAVGSGSAGTVYRAIDDRSGLIVAVKHVTDVALRARFLREVQTLARLDHPSIVRYVGHGDAGDGMYLAMEWLEGEDLEPRIRRGPTGWQEARSLGLALTAALAHAHAVGCVHRDLSPRNVFLPGGRVERAKLLDFGLVRVADVALERTTSQAVLGTPFYMSPEQIRDPKSVDGRADLFSLGVLLFEVLSGTRPFQGPDLFTVWVRIVDARAPDLRLMAPSVPEAFVRIVESLLAKDPNTRPPSASDVHRALAALGGGEGAPGASGSMGSVQGVVGAIAEPPPSTKGRRARDIAIAVGGTAALVAAASSFVVSGRVLQSMRDGRGSPSASSHPPPSEDSSDTTNPARPADAHGASGATAATAASAGVSGRSSGSSGAATPAKPASPAIEDSNDPFEPVKQPDGTIRDFSCGSGGVRTIKGGHFLPGDAVADLGHAIFAGGDCKLTLEDCVIGGKHSINALNAAHVVLRRCRVEGTVDLVGANVVLELESTTLASKPKIVGKGRVIQR